MPTLDLELAQAFVKDLTGSPHTALRFRAIDDDKKRKSMPHEFYGSIYELWLDIERHQADGYGIFYFLNETTVPDPTQTEYARDTDIVRVRAIPADFDEGLPEEWEWHVVPDLLVHTSPGKGQALWLTPGLPLNQFKEACRRIIAFYHCDPAVQNLS